MGLKLDLKADFWASRVPVRAFIAMGLFWGAFGAYVPGLKAQAGLEDAAFGGAMFFGAVGAVAAMAVAPFVDRTLGQWAMVVGCLATALAFLVPGFATNWGLLALAMLLCMGFSGLLDVIMNARLSLIEAETGRSLMNLNHAIFSFAYGGAALGAGFLRQAGVSPELCFAGIGVIVLFLSFGLRHQTAETEIASGPAREGRGLPLVLVSLAGAVTLLGFMAEQASDNWSAIHLERAFGVAAHESALGPAILGVTMGFGRLFGQFLVGVMAEGRVLRLAGAISAAGVLLGAWAPSQLLAYLGFGILGLGVSVVGPMALAWVGKSVAPHQRGLAISRVVLVGYTGFFVGPPALGFLAQHFGLPVAFSVLAVLLMAIPLVLVPALRASARRSEIRVGVAG